MEKKQNPQSKPMNNPSKSQPNKPAQPSKFPQNNPGQKKTNW